jgi:hypothetical protein
MIVDAPCYVPNTVIRKELQMPTAKEEIHRYSSQFSAQRTPKRPHGTTRQHAIAKTLAKLSVYQILAVIAVFAVLVCKV